MGLSLSSIFAIYTGGSIAATFFATAGSFAGLSLWGYSTKKDISAWGSFLIMGVVGLVIAMIANMFIHSQGLALAIPFIGVLIFAGLTAYDTQRLKNEYLTIQQMKANQSQCRRRLPDGQDGGDGRADALPRLHQHVHVPPALHGRQPELSRPPRRASGLI